MPEKIAQQDRKQTRNPGHDEEWDGELSKHRVLRVRIEAGPAGGGAAC